MGVELLRRRRTGLGERKKGDGTDGLMFSDYVSTLPVAGCQ